MPTYNNNIYVKSNFACYHDNTQNCLHVLMKSPLKSKQCLRILTQIGYGKYLVIFLSEFPNVNIIIV